MFGLRFEALIVVVQFIIHLNFSCGVTVIVFSEICLVSIYSFTACV